MGGQRRARRAARAQRRNNRADRYSKGHPNPSPVQTRRKAPPKIVFRPPVRRCAAEVVSGFAGALKRWLQIGLFTTPTPRFLPVPRIAGESVARIAQATPQTCKLPAGGVARLYADRALRGYGTRSALICAPGVGNYLQMPGVRAEATCAASASASASAANHAAEEIAPAVAAIARALG